jgi:hypothetical protein
MNHIAIDPTRDFFNSLLERFPLSYDAGSVTTGVLTAPVVISIAIGLSSVLAGRSAISDGSGLHMTQICAIVSDHTREQENYESGGQTFESSRARQ